MKLLDERQKTHGDFADNAMCAQKIKQVFLSMYHDRLSYVQAEALDMIACKVGRILSGDPNFKDHWDDIIGYAQLARNELNRMEETVPTGSGHCRHGHHFSDCPVCK